MDWQLTSARLEKTAGFLDAVQPYYWKNGPGGGDYVKADAGTLDTGKQVFAENLV